MDFVGVKNQVCNKKNTNFWNFKKVCHRLQIEHFSYENISAASRKQVRVRRPPFTPLLYSKTGVYRGIHFFLFLLQNIDCGYSQSMF